MADTAMKERFDLQAEDGTVLACYRSGTGPAMVMVTGALCDASSWDPMAPYLRDAFTVYTYDRRGRRPSTNVLPYSLEKEIEDLRMVLEATGERPHVFAHSAGALLTLHAVLHGAKVASLSLYEPPIWQALLPEHIDLDLQALAVMDPAGENEELLKTFLRHANHTTDEQMARLEAQARWPNQVAMAPTVFYDTNIARDFDIRGEREALGRIEVPTLLMIGGTSPHRMFDAAEALDDAMPNTRKVTVEGHGHSGIFTAPAVVTAEVRAFLGVPPFEAK